MNATKFLMKVGYALAASVIFIVGMLVNKYLAIASTVSVNAVLDIGDIANFIMSLIIAFLIPVYLNIKVNNSRIAKDLIMVQCSKLEEFAYKQVDELQKLSMKPHLEPHEPNYILSITETLSNRLENLKKLILQQFPKNTDLGNLITQLESHNIQYWKKLTENIKDTIPVISRTNMLLAEKEIHKFTQSLAMISLTINEI